MNKLTHCVRPDEAYTVRSSDQQMFHGLGNEIVDVKS